jgi:7-carboxy-7-deazaguanine synthase
MIPPSSTEAQAASSGLQPPGSKLAPLQEIFSSIQGEGIHVGKRQVFVRFAHCHLKCAYCDTPMTSPSGQCQVENPPGSGQIAYYPNPLTPEKLVELISSLLKTTRHHSVSFTGGEPLLYHAFLKEVLPHIRKLAPVYLETSGTQPEFLQTVLPWVDIIAMDIKLPSATHEPPQYENHARFYELAHAPGKECFIKLVFNAETTPEELEAVKTIVTDRSTPIILQPETSLADRTVHVPAQRILEIEQTLAAHFEDVRVIPQTHKLLNVL